MVRLHDERLRSPGSEMPEGIYLVNHIIHICIQSFPNYRGIFLNNKGYFGRKCENLLI